MNPLNPLAASGPALPEAIAAISFRSCPAENATPDPVSTTTRTPSSERESLSTAVTAS